MNKEQTRLFIGRSEMTILHLSDPHLFAERDSTLLGVKTNESLLAVLDDIDRRHILPDLIVVTGDISQDYTAESYQNFVQYLSRYNKPVFSLAGNHDERSKLKKYLSTSIFSTAEQLITEHWQMLMLNSHVPEKVYGQISQEELQWLKRCLDENSDLPTIIFTHHHPVPVGSAWLDKIGIENGSELVELLSQYPQVQMCAFGHVHQATELLYKTVNYRSVPSTCVQFKKHSKDFSASAEKPGYNLYRCQSNGLIEVDSFRVDDYLPSVNLAISGY
ncbi:3',5'-cyclic-AMP phosphodiesterase [Kangiella sediminilitoris]|uniref:3',5'-cyclic adenosine monophosphate phosphodiesterase CpdA n=1 Tax=Kangiella sediminilitoris TaxID=1144748 RepID=A0A1B3B901_9GAMM|nr:3',5'-cyclic-AMP phosphodiesterase [Kangiella sediminilitoris]AOE49278.1 3',5'-cyclic adenosine monophosphate phosphodiesterase CpdA [Kangiella sediminilitoris]